MIKMTNEKKYELAAKLKESGFIPIQGGQGIWVNENLELLLGPSGLDPSECYLPTSDELIEELGDKFGLLELFIGSDNDKKDFSAFEWAYDEEPENKNIGNGPSPLEALAELYIATHKK